MTGVVGPSGGGKSNLTEALRWVMGKASVRTLHGTELDDVIFAGAKSRGRRNLAEVTLILDNNDGRAPPPVDRGRDHRGPPPNRTRPGHAVPGERPPSPQPAMSRSFSPMPPAARVPPPSSARGRFGQILSARASDRRAVLEEAARIGGLHARRREAEQRLSTTAEANLTRLDDIIATLAEWVTVLHQQVREGPALERLSSACAAPGPSRADA